MYNVMEIAVKVKVTDKSAVIGTLHSRAVKWIPAAIALVPTCLIEQYKYLHLTVTCTIVIGHVTLSLGNVIILLLHLDTLHT